MIIKFQEKDRWVLFGEVDHLEYVELGNCSMSEPHPINTIYYDPPICNVDSRYYEVSFFTKNMNEATIIRCWTPIYIMNDNGRTVETI